jgi:hypothetical protein
MRANRWRAVAVGITLAGACSLSACGSGGTSSPQAGGIPAADASQDPASPARTFDGTSPASAPATTSPATTAPDIGNSGGPPDGAPGPGGAPPDSPSALTPSAAAPRPSTTTINPGEQRSFALGWYTDSSSFDAQQVNAMPVKPTVVNYYSPWLEPFETAFAQDAYADGVETFVELEPWNCGACADGSVPSMTSIATGSYDAYLTGFGQQVEAFGHPIMATFAHEMNGSWYPWGNGGSEHITPAQWIAAWDHVVTVVSAAAPGLINWVWAPNIELNVGPVAPYWPGDKYVSSVGVDGYFSSDSDTYRSIFGTTVADIRTLTNRPIWISETGLNIDATTGTRLSTYIAAVKAAGLSGILYFDVRSWTLPLADQQSLATAINSPAS